MRKGQANQEGQKGVWRGRIVIGEALGGRLLAAVLGSLYYVVWTQYSPVSGNENGLKRHDEISGSDDLIDRATPRQERGPIRVYVGRFACPTTLPSH